MRRKTKMRGQGKTRGLFDQAINPPVVLETHTKGLSRPTSACVPELLHGDCLHLMKDLPPGSVDLIIADLPYGTTQNKWDAVIPFEDLWPLLYRLRRSARVPVILTATQPFTSACVLSNPKHFKYEVIWEKTVGSCQLNVGHQPLRVHESVLLFYEKVPVYNEQTTQGEPYTIVRGPRKKEGYGEQKPSSKDNPGYRHARSVIKVPNPRIKGGHPTQKPLALMERLIATYSNEGDTVLDPCFGSGVVLQAASNLNRNSIGIELDKAYFDKVEEQWRKT